MGLIYGIGIVIIGFIIGYLIWQIRLKYLVGLLKKKLETVENMCVILKNMLDFCDDVGQDYNTVAFDFFIEKKHYNYQGIGTFVLDISMKTDEIRKLFFGITPFERGYLKINGSFENFEERLNTVVNGMGKLIRQLQKYNEKNEK